jgi:uncharacterized protein (TIGR00725 family)
MLDMARRVQISVVGFNDDSCTKAARDAAYRVGKAIAEEGGTVVCGGLGGVMEAASKGALDAGGHSVGIVPSADSSQANGHCDFVVATGLGRSRNFLVAYSGDAMVVVGGGAGTLIEAAAAYQADKPIVAVKGTGGVADAWAGRFMDERRTRMMLEGSSPEDAVKKVMRELSRNGASPGKARATTEAGGRRVGRPQT